MAFRGEQKGRVKQPPGHRHLHPLFRRRWHCSGAEVDSKSPGRAFTWVLMRLPAAHEHVVHQLPNSHNTDPCGNSSHKVSPSNPEPPANRNGQRHENEIWPPPPSGIPENLPHGFPVYVHRMLRISYEPLDVQIRWNCEVADGRWS